MKVANSERTQHRPKRAQLPLKHFPAVCLITPRAVMEIIDVLYVLYVLDCFGMFCHFVSDQLML
jgi:hypothetical protein